MTSLKRILLCLMLNVLTVANPTASGNWNRQILRSFEVLVCPFSALAAELEANSMRHTTYQTRNG